MHSVILKAAAAFLMACVLFAGPVRVHASDNGQYGQLDPFTGKRIEESDEDGGTDASSDIVWLSDNMFFDTSVRMYGYPAGNGAVYSNAADGMILTERVDIVIPRGINIDVFFEGTQIEFTGQALSDIGSYVIRLSDGGQEKSLFSFTIAGKETCRILSYTVPEGFRIVHATLDGIEISYSRKYVDMSAEGDYSIYYECYLTGMNYTLNVSVDTTPPTIVLEGVEADGKARGPVTITGKDANDSLTVYKDGEKILLMLSNTLTQSGNYVATVSDTAGNVSTYPFTIMIYLDRNGWIFILIFVLLIIGTVVYIQYQRTHLRIR